MYCLTVEMPSSTGDVDSDDAGGDVVGAKGINIVFIVFRFHMLIEFLDFGI